MNEKRIWIAFLVMLQLGCCLSFGRYISSLGPLYRKIVPLANPAAALTSKPKRVTVLPIQETIDQGSGDFTRQLSAETPSVQTTFIAMTPAVDGNVTSEDLVSEYYRSLEFDSSGDNETGTLDSSTTVQREIGVSSLRIEEELTTQAFNETSTWNSRPMSTLYSTVQSSKDNKQIDSTSIFSKDNQTNFDTFASAAYTSPFASVLKDIPQEFATKPSNKVIAIKQNSSVKTLPEQNVPILQNKNASQAHTGYCKATAKLSYRLFKHYSVANTSVVEQRISIHFNLHKASNKYVFIDDYTSKTSDCYLSYRILQNSELELQSILGILRYGAPIRIKNHTVWIQLVADFGFGKKIKTSLLRTVYLDAVATNLRTDGITIQNFTIEAERKDISTLCMSTTCDVGTRCQVQESPNERWGECVSWCYDLTYCFNDGICQLNQNGKQICWCPSSSMWWFRGKRCEKMENVIVIAIAAGGSGLLVIVLIVAFVAWIARRTSKSTNNQHQSYRTKKRRCLAQKTNSTTLRHHCRSTCMSSSTRVEEENRSHGEPRNPTFGNDLKMHKILHSMRNPQLQEMVQATNFRSIHSRERAGLSNLHGEVQRSTSAATRLSNSFE